MPAQRKHAAGQGPDGHTVDNVRSIARAHGGDVAANPRDEGGLDVTGHTAAEHFRGLRLTTSADSGM